MPDRIEREIEEILDKIDRFVPEERLPIRFRRRARNVFTETRDFFLSPLARVSLSQVMLIGLGLFIVALFLGRVDSTLARWTMIVGAILFLGGFALTLLSGRSGQQQKRWRGRVVEYGEPALAERLRTWFRRRNHRRQR